MIYLILATILISCKSYPLPPGQLNDAPFLHAIQSLYHAQDIHGQYSYGYSTPTVTKSEIKTADGVTQGGYSYIDTNGILQSVSYIADPIHGFRVAASNLPQDLPDVANAKAHHIAQYEAIKAQHQVPYSNPVAVPFNDVLPKPVEDLPEVVKARADHLAALQAAYANPGVVPQIVQDLPEVAKARAEHLATLEATRARDIALAQSISLSPIPNQLSGSVVPITAPSTVPAQPALPQAPLLSYAPALSTHGPTESQYHTQDSWGQYTYGYIGPLGTKTETKTADGVVRGGYSYIDANGVLQTVEYVADDKHGFRVSASNLPQVSAGSIATATEVAAPIVHSLPPVNIDKEPKAIVYPVNYKGAQSSLGAFTQEVTY